MKRHFTWDTESLSCDEPGFLLTSSFNTGFANDKYTSAVSWVWLFKLVCDDPRNTVLMMPPSIFHYSLEGAAEEMRKLANTVDTAPLDVEMKWEWVVWAEGGGLVVWLEFEWIMACVKARLSWLPRSCWMHFCSWQCVFSISSVSCWIT